MLDYVVKLLKTYDLKHLEIKVMPPQKVKDLMYPHFNTHTHTHTHTYCFVLKQKEKKNPQQDLSNI